MKPLYDADRANAVIDGLLTEIESLRSFVHERYFIEHTTTLDIIERALNRLRDRYLVPADFPLPGPPGDAR